MRANEGLSAVANPVELEHRSGALQAALLEGLGLALAGFESTQSIAARWGRIFDEALRRTADAKAQDLIRGATAFMNGVVRARLGDPAADALEAFEANLMTTLDEQLARRIETQADAGAIAAFNALAEQVAALVGGPVVLSIDRGERLSDDDFRLLLDLVETIPANVHLNIGHTVRDADDEDRIQQLLEAGNALTGPSARLEQFSLEGLILEAVAGWMRERGLDPNRGDDSNVVEVLRVTAGYPLHVDLALTAIAAGQRLGELTGDDALLSMMKRNYRQALTVDDQRAVMLLAAFSDRPDDGVLLEVLDMSAQDWAVLQQRLVTARFLVAYTHADKPWFHELGRRLLWDQVLSADQQEQAARAAIGALLDSIAAAGKARISYCVDLAKLAVLVPDEVDQHAGFSAVLELNRGHLAVLGALDELTEPAQPGAFVGDVVYFARQRFPAVEEDLFDSAEELPDFGIAVVSSSEQDAVVVPHGLSPAANIALVGRIASELGRVPIRTLSNELLHGLLLPAYGEFHQATLGPGYVNLTALARELAEREYDRTSNLVTHEKRPGLILRPRLGDLELAGMVNFDSDEARDLAFDALADRSGSMAFGESWNIDELYKWPQPEPIQERRFAAAAELLTTARFNGSFAPQTVAGMAEVTTVQEELEFTIRFWETIRAIATGLERAVLGLNRSRGAAYFTSETDLIWAEVQGRRDVVNLGIWDGTGFGLEARKAVDRGLGLGPSERVTVLHYRGNGTPKNPVPQLITETNKTMKAFNGAQGIDLRAKVLYNVAVLRAKVEDSVVRRRTDAEALLSAGLFATPNWPLGRKIFMVAVPAQGGAPGTTGRFRDGTATGLYTFEFDTDGADEVHFVAHEDGTPLDFRDQAKFETLFGMPAPGEPSRTSQSWLVTGLEAYLGMPVHIDYPVPERSAGD